MCTGCPRYLLFFICYFKNTRLNNGHFSGAYFTVILNLFLYFWSLSLDYYEGSLCLSLSIYLSIYLGVCVCVCFSVFMSLCLFGYMLIIVLNYLIVLISKDIVDPCDNFWHWADDKNRTDQKIAFCQTMFTFEQFNLIMSNLV